MSITNICIDTTTDADLAAAIGPQWRAVRSLLSRCAALTTDDCTQLRAAWHAVQAAVGIVAWNNAVTAAWSASMAAGRGAAWDVRYLAGHAAGDAAWPVAGHVACAVVAWDLATEDGPYTYAHRALLAGPWVGVCGWPEGLLAVDGEA